MSFLESVIDDRLVTDTEKAAFAALPLLVGADDANRDRFAVQLADILGNPGEFQRYLSGLAPDRLARIDRLLKVFRENTELLVHKTWVEKSEERPKARLLDDLGAFEREFRDGAVTPAFKRFVALANSIASLLFGHQSRAEDFLAYCFRIDPKFGLFFWYVSELEKQAREGLYIEDLLTVETLIGVYVLSSF
ncbi:MAG: hypothetical protein ABSF43_08260 [Rectinemataceae bacterium]|jgi:hypothetical protein